MKKKLLVFLDELFYTVDYKEYKSKSVSALFFKKFKEKYGDEFDISFAFPVYKGSVDDFSVCIDDEEFSVYALDGWHNNISFYKKYTTNKKNIERLVDNLDNLDAVSIRIPSPAGLIFGELMNKKGKKVIFKVVGDIKEAYHNYKFPLNIPAYLISQYLYKKELRQQGTFLTVGSELYNRFKNTNNDTYFFIDSLITKEDIIKPKDDLKKPIKVLYVGRLLESKGIFFLIEAIESMKDYDIELHVVGFGRDEDKVKALSEKYKFIKFYGKISDRSELNKVYKDSDVFILPTINSEGFPRVILEAWANGLFTISSRVGGIEGLAKDKENILFFTPGNMVQLKKQLVALISDKNIQNSLQVGISQVQKKITFDSYAKVFYDSLRNR
jgi:glycosyltransferase involved in cell wall biosynthesis